MEISSLFLFPTLAYIVWSILPMSYLSCKFTFTFHLHSECFTLKKIILSSIGRPSKNHLARLKLGSARRTETKRPLTAVFIIRNNILSLSLSPAPVTGEDISKQASSLLTKCFKTTKSGKIKASFNPTQNIHFKNFSTTLTMKYSFF